MSPLFSRKPKPPTMHSCFLCSKQIEDVKITRFQHYETHLIEVTDMDGRTAFTFECSRCGRMDKAWGGGKEDPSEHAVNAIDAHLLQRHHVDLITRK